MEYFAALPARRASDKMGGDHYGQRKDPRCGRRYQYLRAAAAVPDLRAEVHILDDEAAARAYIEQMWAEAMTVYRSGKYKLSFLC